MYDVQVDIKESYCCLIVIMLWLILRHCLRAIDVIVTRTSRGFQHVILLNSDIDDPPIMITEPYTEILC
jgi:hypothetical protein